jgi:Tfp pilus assembly protein PilV
MNAKINKKYYSGMTIVELLVAMSIFIIGMAGFSLLFVRTWQVNQYALEMGQSSLAVSQGANKMVDYIREAKQGDNGAYPVVSVAGNDLVLYSDYDKNGVTERLHFYKSGQNVLLGVTNPNNSMPVTYPAGDQQIITVAHYIVNDNNTPIFYYYNKNYPADTTNNPLSGTINVSDVRLVKIYLQININPNRAPDNIKIQNFVEMRNLNDYNGVN